MGRGRAHEDVVLYPFGLVPGRGALMRYDLPVTGLLLVATSYVAFPSHCLAQVITERDFKSAPMGVAPRGASPASPSKPHVDYDTIFVDRSDPNKIYGNCRNDAPCACRDKA